MRVYWRISAIRFWAPPIDSGWVGFEIFILSVVICVRGLIGFAWWAAGNECVYVCACLRV